MKLFGFELSRIETIEARIDERAGQILDRYAHNPDALRAAIAGNLGLSHPDYVRSDSMLLAPMSRAIKAYAATVTKLRSPVSRRQGSSWPTGGEPVINFFPRSAQAKSRPLSGSEAERPGSRELPTSSRLPASVAGRAAA